MIAADNDLKPVIDYQIMIDNGFDWRITHALQ